MAEFISIFETKSQRVKGLALHPTRPWLLVSLYSGGIQLWDYRVRTLIDRFDEHDGPVRTVAFHPTQPMFVSGGDDNRVKVWNYKERRCLFTMTDHTDYVRTAQFHPEQPWILTCSDDKTIRIWDWQSRKCISTMIGHSHYVMSASFHPTEDLVVSASLDQTVRIWDISGLRKKGLLPQGPIDDATRLQNEIFGSGDAVVKDVLEGHERGVNWAAFHPTSPLIISGADDRQLKLWRFNENKAWEFDTLRGHFNNVSCCLFHPHAELILSNSEDKTLRVWDLQKREAILTHSLDTDRFWFMTAHPRLSYFAAAHDSGLVVFKLQRERPPTTTHGNSLYYVKDRYLRSYNLENGKDTPLVALKSGKYSALARSLAYSPRDHAMLVTFSQSSGEDASQKLRYELYKLAKKGASSSEGAKPLTSGIALSVAWVKRSRIALLGKANVIHVVDLSGEVVKQITPPIAVTKLLPAPTDCLLMRGEDKVVLYDVQQERVLAEMKVSGVISAIWQEHASENSSGPMVALIARGSVIVCSRRLQRLVHVPETLRVKSAVWDEQGILLYSTPAHIKYCIPAGSSGSGGDFGIVRTIDRVVYLAKAFTKKARIFLLDRTAKVRGVTIDTTEYLFKRALSLKRFDEVLRMVRDKKLIGTAIVGYLQRAGYPELALHFVNDPLTRFNLSLQCNHSNNINVAKEAAIALNDKNVWKQLGQEALVQGHGQVVEKSYQQTLDFEKLSFFYTACGNRKSLSKMLSIAESKRNDLHAQFYNSLLLGDIESRVRLLERSSQLQLAYLTATTHGLTELAAGIKDKLQNEHDRKLAANGQESSPIELPSPSPTAKLMLPPLPVLPLVGEASNWPRTRIARGPFDSVVRTKKSVESASTSRLNDSSLAAPDDDVEVGGAWGDDDDLDLSGDDSAAGDDGLAPGEEDNEGDGWGEEDELDLDELIEDEGPAVAAVATNIALPPAGPPPTETWARNSPLAADQIAAGRFDQAMRLLNEQIGAVNFAPLKPHFLSIYRARVALLPMSSGLSATRSFIDRNRTAEEFHPRESLPRLPTSLQSCIDSLSSGYAAFTGGKFTEALDIFRSILHAIPLVVVQTSKEIAEIQELIKIAREYILGLVTELKRKEAIAAGKDGSRIVELAAYFTHCQLQSKHQQLALKSAMTAAAKTKNFGLAEDFARRLLDLHPSAKLQAHCDKVLKLCEQRGRQDSMELAYDSRNPFVLCAGTLKPIYQGNPHEECPYCGASFIPAAKGRPCTICRLSSIGADATGLLSMPPKSQRR
eukprot:TRINITY_DN5258_c0_g1_i1.p1 TRINITY_DN5258_c0_g1~~TRINITY_DN5258_c0_g1_i1.p1  ORF type:complete len:1293 (+),score=283.65 TRINITY_DN5258_c0_g1_i1:54-3881(+)